MGRQVVLKRVQSVAHFFFLVPACFDEMVGQRWNVRLWLIAGDVKLPTSP